MIEARTKKAKWDPRRFMYEAYIVYLFLYARAMQFGEFSTFVIRLLVQL